MHVGARAVLPRLRHFRTGLLLAALSFAANVQAQPEQPLAMARRALDSGNIDQAVRLLGPGADNLLRESARNFKRLMEAGEIPTNDPQPMGTCVKR